MEGSSKKYEKLRRFIDENGRGGAVVALSGGVDSSTLTAVCRDVLKDRVVAATALSPTYPSSEVEEAQKIAAWIGVKHYIIETDEMFDEDFVRNPYDRCYYCKRDLLSRLQSLAYKIGFKVVFEGTNFSDLGGHRPGFKAVEESGSVFSPWVEARFTKDEIRVLARRLALPVHDKPPLACLASRIPFGERITEERLKRVERAEQFIKSLTGVRQLRVRDHNELARIEVGKDERSLVLDVEIMDKIAEKLRELGFKFVTVDAEGYRTGNMLAAGK